MIISVFRPPSAISHYINILESSPKETKTQAANELLSRELSTFLENLVSNLTNQKQIDSLNTIQSSLPLRCSTLTKLKNEVVSINHQVIKILKSSSKLENIAEAVTPPRCSEDVFHMAMYRREVFVNHIARVSRIKDPIAKITALYDTAEKLIRAKNIDDAVEVLRAAFEVAEALEGDTVLQVMQIRKISKGMFSAGRKDLTCELLMAAIEVANTISDENVKENCIKNLTEELTQV